VVDKPNTQIPLSAIDQLEQLLEQVPVYHATAVSKRLAIARLSPQLHALRAKGYTWKACALWLTEHGLAITPSVLTEYLQPGPIDSAATPSKAHRPTRKRADAASMRPAAAIPAAALPTRDPSASTAVPNELAERRGGQRGRRSEFPIRPDSEEI
jgi:hypothetical protein